ncbi:PIN domain nuclease of toxin-antitoxin system [Sphingomonas sp. UYAg733]
MSRYLLDTHGLIWWWTNPDRLGPAGRELIAAGDHAIVVSVASVWEIAIKTQSGKLAEIENFERDYKPLMESNGFESLAVADDHAMRAGFLPGAHRDPFDRLLAAQALIEGMSVITRDPEFAAFGCDVIW